MNHNLPRVFLSYSKDDSKFIERIYKDLNRCKIYSWKDDIDIRHGQPWLDEIFEKGIPTCDCILVYLTENSIASNMVKKEIDASLIQKLKDSRISFLPYISFANLRSKLRPDLQSLQVPEWNEENYNEVFPRVVSEIWRSYMERIVFNSISEEKVKRLEVELELHKLKELDKENIFNQAEEKDFSYIFNSLNKETTIQFHKKYKEKMVETYDFSLNILSIFFNYIDYGLHIYDWYVLTNVLSELFINSRGINDKEVSIICTRCPELKNELLMYGLITQTQYLETVTKTPFSIFDSKNVFLNPKYYTETKLRWEFTEKMHRFRYWIAYKKYLLPKLNFKKKSTKTK